MNSNLETVRNCFNLLNLTLETVELIMGNRGPIEDRFVA